MTTKAKNAALDAGIYPVWDVMTVQEVAKRIDRAPNTPRADAYKTALVLLFDAVKTHPRRSIKESVNMALTQIDRNLFIEQ